ncbi:hypothetical protein [Amycolatopsis magusensis]|uniref:hypothetical protein n=1 Tax=Amycolatopsis magusensis TaxID=882444 RepID=UPI0037B959E0
MDAALAGLDACALLEPHLRAYPKTRTVPEGEHTCVLERADWTPLQNAADGARFTLLVGHSWDTLRRFGMEPVVINEARAYQQQQNDEKMQECQVWIPLSFTRGIKVHYTLGQTGPGVCPVMHETLVGVVDVVRSSPHGALLFRPDENDSGLVGDCAHFPTADMNLPCEPYQPVDVPTEPDALLTTGDVRIQCAVANEAIRRRFGEHLKPIIWGEHCIYVEPTLQRQIIVNLIPDWAPGAYSDLADPDTGSKTVDIGGRPATTFFTGEGGSYEIYWSPHGDLAAFGAVHLELQVRPPRGFFTFPGPTVTDEQVSACVGAMSDIVADHFPPE